MINDIERYEFWNREMVDFLKKENQKKIDLLMRWDSVTNKVPFVASGGIEPVFQNTYTRKEIKTLGVDKD